MKVEEKKLAETILAPDLEEVIDLSVLASRHHDYADWTWSTCPSPEFCSSSCRIVAFLYSISFVCSCRDLDLETEIGKHGTHMFSQPTHIVLLVDTRLQEV